MLGIMSLSRLSIFRMLAVAAVVAGLVNLGLPRTRAAVQGPPLKTESQLRTEAGLYDAAIREISRIETMNLTTVDEVSRVKTLLERHVPNLRFNRSRLVAFALTDTTFVNAAKSRASTKASANEFAKQLVADSQSIFRLNGGAAVKDKVSRSFQSDVSMLKRVSEKLRRAAVELKPQSPAHHANVDPTALKLSSQRITVRDTLTVIVVASVLVSAAMLVGPLLGLELLVMAGLVAVVGGTDLLIAGASILVVRALTNISSEEGRDKIADCLQGVDAKKSSCETENPLYAAVGGCLAEWVLNAAACLAVE